MRNYLLLTPGPLSTSQSVKEVMLQDWCTWDDDYNLGIVTVIRKKILNLAMAHNEEEYTTILLQGSGTYSVEATLGCAVKPSDKILIASNGAYGDRMVEISNYYKLNTTVISLEEEVQLRADHLRAVLEVDTDITHVAFVHCETTTGILNPIDELSSVVKEFGKTLIVDAMSSFGGIEMDVSTLGIDFMISSANKCIQGIPGFGFVIAKKSALDKCKGVSRSLSLDLYDQWQTMETGGGKWRFTSPTHVVRAFLQALIELEEEGGVKARNARYSQSQKILTEGMIQAGFSPLLPMDIQSPIITSFLYPSSDFSFKWMYEKLKKEGFVIYPGKISRAATFRIGTIGDVFPDDIKRLVEILNQ